MVPIGHEELTAVDVQGKLKSGRHVERRPRRIAQREGADVRDRLELTGAVDAVDAHDIAAADVIPDEGDQRIRGLADELDVHDAPEADDGRR